MKLQDLIIKCPTKVKGKLKRTSVRINK